MELQQLGPRMDYQVPESVPLLSDGPNSRQQQKAEVKRSKLLTVCPFILGRPVSLMFHSSIWLLSLG